MVSRTVSHTPLIAPQLNPQISLASKHKTPPTPGELERVRQYGKCIGLSLAYPGHKVYQMQIDGRWIQAAATGRKTNDIPKSTTTKATVTSPRSGEPNYPGNKKTANLLAAETIAFKQQAVNKEHTSHLYKEKPSLNRPQKANPQNVPPENLAGLDPAIGKYLKTVAPTLLEQIKKLSEGERKRFTLEDDSSTDSEDGFPATGIDTAVTTNPPTTEQIDQEKKWHIEEKLLENRGSHIDYINRRISIDPRIAIGDPDGFPNPEKPDLHAYIYTLAHQVGCTQDAQPISLQSRDAYIHDNLCREANGIWNELKIRHDIMASNGPDIWTHRRSEFHPLAKIYADSLAPWNTPPTRKKIVQILANLPTVNGKTTYAKAYGQQYDAFQISETTHPNIVHYAQDYFNETGAALPANQIALYGRTPNGLFNWLKHEHARLIQKDRAPNFHAYGILNHEIPAAIMDALLTGTLYSLSSDGKENYYTYHDPIRNRVFGMLITHGNRQGEIVDATIPGPVYSIKNVDGHSHWMRPEKILAIAQNRSGFLANGIPAHEISDVIMTGLAAGTPEPHRPEYGNWRLHLLQYKTTPNLFFLWTMHDDSGEILDAELQSAGNQTHAEIKPNHLEMILAHPEKQFLHALAESQGMDAPTLLAKVIRSENQKRSSLEWPGFGVYRVTINGENITLCAKIQNGQITNVLPGSALDNLLAHAPEQEKIYAQLQRDGWDIKIGAKGGGSYCSESTREIVMDCSDQVFSDTSHNPPIQLLNYLAHEMAHATFSRNPSHSEEEYVRQSMIDEGNALFAEYKLLDEVSDPAVRSALLEIMQESLYAQEENDVYQRWKQNKSADAENADETARIEFGEIYKKFQPSICPDGVTYEEYWKISYRQWQGNQNKGVLMAQLQSQIPPVQIWALKEEWQPPSFDNIQYLHTLPHQADNGPSKLIFLSKETFMREAKSMDMGMERFEQLINYGLNYGKLNVIRTPNGSDESGVQVATSHFSDGGRNYKIDYIFDTNGQIFDLKIH